MPVPERKEKTPFIGAQILDGTTAAYDWTGRYYALRDLPKSLNPKKGYIVTANNRQTSDHAKLDTGAAVNTLARSLRINEMISEGINSGKKLTLADMGAIQQDVVDVFARDLTPKIVDIIRGHKDELTSNQLKELAPVLSILEAWNGSFDETSVAASIYMKWYIQFTRSLFIKYIDSEDDRLALVDNWEFPDAY